METNPPESPHRPEAGEAGPAGQSLCHSTLRQPWIGTRAARIALPLKEVPEGRAGAPGSPGQQGARLASSFLLGQVYRRQLTTTCCFSSSFQGDFLNCNYPIFPSIIRNWACWRQSYNLAPSARLKGAAGLSAYQPASVPGPLDMGCLSPVEVRAVGLRALEEDVEREVPTSVALPTALCTLPYKSSLWVWSQGGLWDLGSLGTDWEQGNLSKSWWQEFKPLIPIQPPMSRQCP